LNEEKNSEYENENGEKYTLRRLKEEDTILKEPIIIGIFSCFCAFSANVSLIISEIGPMKFTRLAWNRR
jgi:hypothetical protein